MSSTRRYPTSLTSCAANELEPLGILVGILPIARLSAWSRRQQSDFLVVSDGLGIEPGLLRELPDPHLPSPKITIH